MTKNLQDMRQEIDEIDEKIHELLIKRALVVKEVGELKKVLAKGQKMPNNIRIDRECNIIKGLIKRHQGAFPCDSLIRIWREIISASLRIEGQLLISALSLKNSNDAKIFKMISDYFGSFAEIKTFGTARQVIQRVDAGKATLAVLPCYLEDDEDFGWWANLAPKLKIVTRLPVIPEIFKSDIDAFVVAKTEYTPTEKDVSLLKVESKKSVSKNSVKEAIVNAGFDFITFEDTCQIDGKPCYLVSVNGFIPLNSEKFSYLLENAPILTNVGICGWYPII